MYHWQSAFWEYKLRIMCHYAWLLFSPWHCLKVRRRNRGSIDSWYSIFVICDYLEMDITLTVQLYQCLSCRRVKKHMSHKGNMLSHCHVFMILILQVYFVCEKKTRLKLHWYYVDIWKIKRFLTIAFCNIECKSRNLQTSIQKYFLSQYTKLA